MANVVGVVALSHSPSWEFKSQTKGPGEKFSKAVEKVRNFNGEKIDAIVLFGPDHYRNFFYDVLPQFCIGVELLEGYGDYGSPSGKLPVAMNLSKHVFKSVMAAGFDPAISFNMCVDHGLTQPYAALNPNMDIPVIPIVINCQGGPRPSYQRVADFGRAIGDAVRAFHEDINILMVGSGGLSHFLPKMSADDPATPADTRDYIIHGRSRSREFNAEKESVSDERRRQGKEGPINTEWDAWFLQLLTSKKLDPLYKKSDSEIEETAGNGAHELRTWIAATAAWGGDVKTIEYEPVPTWITGMGIVGGGLAIPES